MSDPLPPPMPPHLSPPAGALSPVLPSATPSSIPSPNPWAGEPEFAAHDVIPESPSPQRSGRRTWMLLAAVLAVAVAGVGALVSFVGGGGEESYALGAAAQQATEADTLHFEATLSGPSVETLTYEGAIDADAQLMTMSMELDESLGLGEGSMDFLFDLDDAVMYLGTGFFGETLPVGASWVSVDLAWAVEMGGGSLDELQDLSSLDPTGSASLLIDDENAVEIGPEEIDGESVMHYRTTIDLAELWAASGQDQQMLDELVAEMDLPESVAFDVWVTEDNLLRRMVYEMPIMGDLMTYQFDVVSLGEPVDVQLPSDDDVIDISELLDF